jgi:vitamin B12 transporter
LEEVVVTATRTPQRPEEIAASVTVLRGEDLERRQVRMIAEVLREVPGVTVVQTGGPGGTTSVFLRGAGSNQTLVLIDGVKVNSPTTGTTDWSNLTAENIDRIEIIRGPQSTLYGSEAMGGVIQIFTKRGRGKPEGAVGLEAGSFKTFRERASVRGETGPLDYSLSVSRWDTEGISRANEKNGNAERDGYQNTTFSARMGLSFAGDGRADLTMRHLRARAELDGFGLTGPVDDLNFLQRTRETLLALNVSKPLIRGWEQTLHLSTFLSRQEFTDPDTVFNNAVFDTKTHRLDWQHNFTLTSWSLLTVGYEYLRQEGENAGNFDASQTTQAVYAQNQFRWGDRAFLNLGLRYTDNNRFGDHVNGKTELAYLLRESGTKLRAAYGTGFRAPSLNDLYFPGFGNPDLKPEENRSFEAGVDQELGKGNRLGLTLFHQRFDNLIAFVVDPVTGAFRPINVAKARSRGLEVSADAVPHPALRLRAIYTFNEAEDEETGVQLARRPRHRGSFLTIWTPHPAWELTGSLLYVGGRFSGSKGTDPLEAHTLVNLMGSYQVSKAIRVFAKIENLFDREYEEVKGYGTPGFGVFVGVHARF